MGYSQLEQMQRWLEEGLARSEREMDDLLAGIGEAAQAEKLLRQGAGNGTSGPVACGTFTLTVSGCVSYASAVLPGATVTLTKSGDPTVSGTTNGSGQVTLDVYSAGTVNVQITHPDHQTLTTTKVVTCTTTNSQSYTLTQLYKEIRHGEGTIIRGCGCALPGATVTLNRVSPALSVSGTSDSAGKCVLLIPYLASDAWTWSISAPHYTTATGSFNQLSGCFWQGLSGPLLASDVNYFCYGGNPPFCRDLMPASVSITFSANTALFGSLAGTTKTINRTAGLAEFRNASQAITGSSVFTNATVDIRVEYTNNGTCVAPNPQVRLIANVIGTFTKSSGTGACPIAWTASGTVSGQSGTITVS